MPEKHYRVRWEIDIWDETPNGAAYQAARYAEEAAFSSVFELIEIEDGKQVGKPVLVDLEEVLFEGENQ